MVLSRVVDRSTIIVFDLDGTLLKFNLKLSEARDKVAQIGKKYGLELRKGEAIQEMMDRAKEVLNPGQWVELRREIMETMMAYEDEAAEIAEPREGIVNVLTLLKEKGFRLAVATNTHRKSAEKSLNITGLSKYFEKVVTRDEVERLKPRPDLLLKVAELFNVSPAELVYIGDSVNDYRSAVEAGVRFIALLDGVHGREDFTAAGVTEIASNPFEILNHLGIKDAPLKVVPDTSAIINGTITKLVESGELDGAELIIPVAAVDELQAQASQKREPGFIGLNELKKIRSMSGEHRLTIEFAGERPSLEEIKLARKGRIDALIRDVAKRRGAWLYTSDYVQSLVAEAEGISVKYFPAHELPQKMSFEQYFTEDTLSLHFKEGAPLMAKRGRPGNFQLVLIGDKPLETGELNSLIKEITEHARQRPEGSMEIVRSGAFVAQIGDYRIAVARPPFSDGLEITIVRPIVKLRLEDYRLPKKLLERFELRAEGILIAGPPGSGKSTFAASLAEFYSGRGKIVKTIESPRDLQVGPEITQYGPLEGDFEKTAEILLLVRPDYTVFDEIRKDRDFQIFSDMRLAGIGMIGVVHSSDAVGAIQRFIGRVELGMIPHIIDTVIFLEAGQVTKVFTLALVVRVPTGMTEADLARPLVEVRDFFTNELEYEIYTYGEENVIIPVKHVQKYAAEVADSLRVKVLEALKKFDESVDVEVVGGNKVIAYVERDVMPRLIGRKGETITSLEKELGVSIDVMPRVASLGREIKFEVKESGATVNIEVGKELAGRRVNVYVDNEYLFSATVGRNGSVAIRKKSEHGKTIIKNISAGRALKVILAD